MNTPQGSSGQDSKGETICVKGVGVGGPFLKGEDEEVWLRMEFPLFWKLVHWSVRAYGYFEVGHLSIFSMGVTVGPFCIPLLKTIV